MTAKLRPKREGWVDCSCGKVRHVVVREDTESLVDAMFRLQEISVCRSCEADGGRVMDRCPESVGVEDAAGRGVSACNLPWNHVGRCEPMDTPTNIAERLREMGFVPAQDPNATKEQKP